MIPPRVIPVLQLDAGYLVKTQQFGKSRYIGDPVNAVRVFNDKRVDELIVCDVSASRTRSVPDFTLLSAMASEAFMPLGYGGNVRSLSMAQRIIDLGFEKVIVGSALVSDPAAVGEIAATLGAQSVAASVDFRRNMLGRPSVFVESGSRATQMHPVQFATGAIALGAGEILLTSIDREGTGRGYDLDLIRQVAASTTVPLVALGGAAGIDDFQAALDAGASAVAAGTRFVLHGPRRAVLITYPDAESVARLAR